MKSDLKILQFENLKMKQPRQVSDLHNGFSLSPKHTIDLHNDSPWIFR